MSSYSYSGYDYSGYGDYSDSQSYGDDYSYSDYPDPPAKSGAASKAKVKAAPGKAKAGEDSYDYDDYSDTYYDDGYSGSYSGTQSEVAKPQRTTASAAGSKTKPDSTIKKSIAASFDSTDDDDAADSYYDYSDDYSYSDTGSKPGATQRGQGSKQRNTAKRPLSEDYDDYYSYDDSYSGDVDADYYDDYSSYGYSDENTDRAPQKRKTKGKTSLTSYYSGYSSKPYSYSDEDYYYNDSYYSGQQQGSGSGYYDDSGKYSYSSSYSYPYKESGQYTGYYYDDDGDDDDYYYSGSSGVYSYSGYSYSTDEQYTTYSYSSYRYSSDTPHSSRKKKRHGTPDTISKYDSSTTSSYQYYYTDSRSSIDARSESLRPREVVVLRTPLHEIPTAPPAPKRCFTKKASRLDCVHLFLSQLMSAQEEYETSRAQEVPLVAPASPKDDAAPLPLSATEERSGLPPPVQATSSTETVPTAAAAGATTQEEQGEKATEPPAPIASSETKLSKSERKKQKAAEAKRLKLEKKARKEAEKKVRESAKKSAKQRRQRRRSGASGVAGASATFEKTPSGFFSARSVRLCLSILRVDHATRRSYRASLPTPTPFNALYEVVQTQVIAAAKSVTAQAFLSADPSRSGELPLSTVIAILRDVGLTRSLFVEGRSVNIAVDPRGGNEAMLEVSSAVQQDSAATASANARSSVTIEKSLVPVCRIVREQVKAKQPTTVRWEGGCILMGNYLVCRGVTQPDTFEYLKTYIEACTYVCVLTHLYSIANDISQAGTEISVQYPHLVRNLLNLSPPPAPPSSNSKEEQQRQQQQQQQRRNSRGEDRSNERSGSATVDDGSRLLQRVSVYIQSVFRHVFRPAENIRNLQFSGPVRGDGEQTTQGRKHDYRSPALAARGGKMGDARVRELVPFTSEDLRHFELEAPHDDYVDHVFALDEVHIPLGTPEAIRYFCLVSILPAGERCDPVSTVEVPVETVRTTTAKDGSTLEKWLFSTRRDGDDAGDGSHKKRHKKKEDKAHHHNWHIHFHGAPRDRLYVECCYETRTTLAVGDTQEQVTDIWCAGHVVLQLEQLRRRKHHATPGSLLPSGLPDIDPADGTVDSNGALQSSEAAQHNRKETKKEKKKRKKQEKRNSANAVSEILIKRVKKTKTFAHLDYMPDKYLLLENHQHLVMELRRAIMMIGKRCHNVKQALAQQYVQQLLTVVRDSVLLDQLRLVWRDREADLDKDASESQRGKALLLCACAIAALRNCRALDKKEFAAIIIEGRPLEGAYGENAPQAPVWI